jgi:predicted phosphodiesterase
MFILTSDLHLRLKPPKCRIDDWRATMARKLKFLSDLSDTTGFPILCAGDLFDEPYRNPKEPSYELLHWALQNLPENFRTIIGNHDIPAHNWDKFDISGVGFVDRFTKIIMKQGEFGFDVGHWNKEIKQENDKLIIHTMCWHNEKPYPDAPDEGNAYQIMDKYKGYKLIVTGDNHTKFVVERDGQTLINPGSLFRLRADQFEYKPSVFIWDGECEEIPVPLDCEINTDYIDNEMERASRMVWTAIKTNVTNIVSDPIETVFKAMETSHLRPGAVELIKNIITEIKQ